MSISKRLEYVEYDICIFVFSVGMAADGLQEACTSSIPGFNITVIVTTPIFVGCKVFVWCCRNFKLPWRKLLVL